MRTNKKLYAISVFFLVVILSVSVPSFAFNKKSSRADEDGAVKIGVILPLTGYSAYVGESLKKGMDVALQEINAGRTGTKIKLLYEDSAGETRKTVGAYNRLTSIKKVHIVVVASTGAHALIPLADMQKNLLFCTAVSDTGIVEKSKWVFRLFINAETDASIIARYAANILNYKKMAVIYINDNMGLSYKDVFMKTLEEEGGKITITESYDFNQADFKPLLLKVKATKPEAVYLVGYGNNMAVIPVQMQEVGLHIPLLSVGTISQPSIMKQAGDAVEGVIYTTTDFNTFAPKTTELKNFVNAFMQKYNAPPIFFEVFGYDTIGILANVINNYGRVPASVRDGLREMRNLQRAVGPVSFNYYGDAVFPVILKKIENGQWVPIQ